MTKKPLPPESTRYCMCCKTLTTWRYDRYIGHSRCIECGWHHIPTLDPDHKYEKERQQYLLLRNASSENISEKDKEKKEIAFKNELYALTTIKRGFG